ncbi:hypothetical protein [Acinetobacter radioresistens]|uniref:hypothetical protein n=1 Tax=Acinetobacter radioresistens TaxID=40216 RepID=UPI00028C5C34|nr:hypothetical protein [Acinetobacter radioresistens]EKU3442082.1 hypothetical protein [Acinetobacter baumannii]BBL22264.1 hypothetical protein ACRAD_29350 [Acinetobacter radioresistens DSM 6976 = NBRC 102413 = CIP 103788]
MNDLVIYYTATSGTLKGHIFVQCFVDSLTQAEIDAKLAQLRSEGYEGLNVGSYQEYEKAAAQASYAAYKAYVAQPSTAEQFKEMFNIMPPQNHVKYEDFELFNVREQLDAGLYNFFVRIADQYFKIVARRDSNKFELANLCRNAIAA